MIFNKRKILFCIVGILLILVLTSLLIASNTKIKHLEEQLKQEKSMHNSAVLQHDAEIDDYQRLVAEQESEIESLSSALQIEQGKNAIWEGRVEEFPVATECWMYMKSVFGWNDAVCAGVIGNFMSETGGQTLNLDWKSNSGPYGLAQWLGGRKLKLKNKYGEYPTVQQQLEFMHDELYGTNGVTQQVTDWQRDRILNASTAREAAEEFARWFERPASTKYNVRQSNAERALDYFT